MLPPITAFESFVNSEGCKAEKREQTEKSSLRALLIQKGVKLLHAWMISDCCLRALLIQKGVKRLMNPVSLRPVFESFVNSEGCKALDQSGGELYSLRALLIQKGVKHLLRLKRHRLV